MVQSLFTDQEVPCSIVGWDFSLVVNYSIISKDKMFQFVCPFSTLFSVLSSEETPALC